MTENSFESILYEKDGATGIVVVTINRPEIKNALTWRVLLELCWAAEAAAKDDSVKALIMTGARSKNDNDPAKEAFSSGGYFNPADLESMDEATKREIDLADLAQKKLCLKLWSLYKPVIVAMNGLAIGGGLTIPLACADLIFASEYAWAKLPFVNLGIVPELASSYLLPRLVGFQKAKEIMFFGEPITAQQMLDLKLLGGVGGSLGGGRVADAPVTQPEANVVLHGKMRKQCVVLRHVADATLARLQARHVLALDEYASRIHPPKTADAL